MKLYPAFQDYFRKAKPPLLAIWGKNDPFFIPAGAEAFRKDIPNARVRVSGYRAFCHRDARCRNCGRDERVPGSQWRIAPDRQRGITMSSLPRTPRSCWSMARGLTVLAGRRSFCRCEREGLTVTCAPIPLTSLTEDIAALERVIERTRGPVLLAGHAYAGAVIAGAKDDRVKSLVYVAALAPAEGETVADVFYRAKPHPEAPHLEPDAHGLIWMPEGGFARAVAHGFSGPDRDSGGRAAADRGEMHSRESACAGVENEAIVVSVSGRGSHDCAGDAMLYGGADGREDSDTPRGPQSDAYGAGCSGRRDSRSGTGDARATDLRKHPVAIVTGASQGIGRATAIRLARDFEAVVLAARQEDELDEDRGRGEIRGRRTPDLCARFARALLGRNSRPGHARPLWQNRRSAQHCRRRAADRFVRDDGRAVGRRLGAQAARCAPADDTSLGCSEGFERRGGADLRKRGSRSEAGLRGRSDHQRRHHCAREGLRRARHSRTESK